MRRLFELGQRLAKSREKHLICLEFRISLMSMAWRLGSKIWTIKRAKHVAVCLITGKVNVSVYGESVKFVLTVGRGEPVLGN